MKFAWHTKILNPTASNSAQVEEVDLDDVFTGMLRVDESAAEFSA
jgi:hypothetical protein